MEGEAGELRTRILIRSLCVVMLFLLSRCNPFAPEIDTSDPSGTNIISDQKSLEGVFQNFRYAYTFKDTTIYGALLANDFTFTYRNYEKLVDVSWGRDEEMRITSRLFENATGLDLIWNNIVGFSGDSVRSNVTRSFNLVVTFNPSDVARVDGRVSLELERPGSDDPWKISLWKDESNF